MKTEEYRKIDEFYVKMLEDFKNNFGDDLSYQGEYVKRSIDGLIARIK